MSSRAGPIRVTFVEPSLAAYRVPFFQRLAREPDLRVTLLYADSGRKNAPPIGFEAKPAPRDIYRLLGHPIYWQPAQLEAVDSNAADVVSFDWDVHYASLVPALLRAKREGVATILWGHGTSKHDGTIKAWPRRALARLADVIVTYSEPTRQSYLEAGWSSDRAFCAPNAIDQGPIQAAYTATRFGHPDEVSTQRAARAALGWSGEGPLLLFVSRLDPIRRVDVLVDALELLSKSFPTLRLAIIGEGQPERTKLEAKATAQGVLDRVVFVGAEYDEKQLALWYAASDVVVHPAGLGLSVYHAMGHGRPIVIGDDPGTHGPEATSVINGVTGLRFRSGDVRACAEAVCRLLGDPQLRQAMGQTARQRALQEHSIETMTHRFADTIRAAAKRASR